METRMNGNDFHTLFDYEFFLSTKKHCSSAYILDKLYQCTPKIKTRNEKNI